MSKASESLITADPESGLALANELAEHVQSELEHKKAKAVWAHGLKLWRSSRASKEMIASLLFYTIAMANRGWAGRKV